MEEDAGHDREGGEGEGGRAGVPADEEREAGEDLEREGGEDERAGQAARGGVGHVAGDVAELGEAGGDEDEGDQGAAGEAEREARLVIGLSPEPVGRDLCADAEHIYRCVFGINRPLRNRLFPNTATTVRRRDAGAARRGS